MTDVVSLVAAQRPGHELTRKFSTNAAMHAVDLETIWRHDWLFVAHECELAEPGDVASVTIGTDSVLVPAATDKRLRGLRNLCCHRGCSYSRHHARTSAGPSTRITSGSAIWRPAALVRRHRPRRATPANSDRGILFFCK